MSDRIIQIKYQETHLELTPLAAKALLAFACKDETRAHLHGLAVHSRVAGDTTLCFVVATDGHALVMFDACVSSEAHNRMVAQGYQGRVWSRAYVETQVKIAAAIKSNVQLEYSQLGTMRAPPFDQVIPANGNETKRNGLPAFEAEIFSRVHVVAKACFEGSKANQAVRCMYLGGPLDPAKFRVECASTGLGATVVMMPVRI